MQRIRTTIETTAQPPVMERLLESVCPDGKACLAALARRIVEIQDAYGEDVQLALIDRVEAILTGDARLH